MLTGVNPSECGTEVTHRTTGVTVFTSRSSNPTFHELTFLLARRITLTGILHWTGNRRLITGVASNQKFVTFSLLANRCHLLFWNCRCTDKNQLKIKT